MRNTNYFRSGGVNTALHRGDSVACVSLPPPLQVQTPLATKEKTSDARPCPSSRRVRQPHGMLTQPLHALARDLDPMRTKPKYSRERAHSFMSMRCFMHGGNRGSKSYHSPYHLNDARKALQTEV
jgi:hypothetical protein